MSEGTSMLIYLLAYVITGICFVMAGSCVLVRRIQILPPRIARIFPLLT